MVNDNKGELPSVLNIQVNRETHYFYQKTEIEELKKDNGGEVVGLVRL